MVTDCPEREQLTGEYFEALDEHRRVSGGLAIVAESHRPEVMAVARKQAEAALEQCYDAWRALNGHLHSHACGA